MRTYSSVRSQVRNLQSAVAFCQVDLRMVYSRCAHNGFVCCSDLLNATARMPPSKTTWEPIQISNAVGTSKAHARVAGGCEQPAPVGVCAGPGASCSEGLWAIDLATWRASSSVSAPVMCRVTTWPTPSPSSTIWWARLPQTMASRRSAEGCADAVVGFPRSED